MQRETTGNEFQSHYYIDVTKNKDHIINFEIPPADHLTKAFILNPGKCPCNKKTKDHIINFKILPVDHLTKNLILNPVEDSRSAPTIIPKQHHSVMRVHNEDKVLESTPHIFK